MKKFLYLFFLLLAVVGRMSNADAQIVNIPDANFKAKLVALGVDTNNDGNIQTSEAHVVMALNVSYSNIFDITGIADFVNLQFLNCAQNQISTLDVSTNVHLVSLICAFTQITNLDISQNVNLKYLHCASNFITTLDMSNNAALERLICNGTQLASLDFSNNPNLRYLDCSSMQLTNLNLPNNPLLDTLYCIDHQLHVLDVSSCTQLQLLDCSYGSLNYLMIKNTSIESYLKFSDNQDLKQVCADFGQIADVQTKIQQYGLSNIVVDSICEWVAITNPVQAPHFQYYPNPAQNTLTIETAKSEQFLILNLMGQIVKQVEVKGKETVDISALPKGIYFLQAKTKSVKFVKE